MKRNKWHAELSICAALQVVVVVMVHCRILSSHHLPSAPPWVFVVKVIKLQVKVDNLCHFENVCLI